MAVDRLTGCSAIIVPRRIAHATRTQCLSMLIPFLGLRTNILFLSTMVGIVPTEPSRRGTGPQNRALLHRKAPIERPVDALCRCPADRFVAPTPERVHRTYPSLASDWTGPDLLFRAKHLFLAAMVAISPCRAVRDGELGPSSASILNGNSLNPDDAKGALPPAYPPLQTCRRPMGLQRKSNAGTMNPHRSSGDERAIADT
jgi:hypothetical protein